MAKDTAGDSADAALWQPYLNDGERLLWQGRPASGIRLDGRLRRRLAFGILFIAIFVYLIFGEHITGTPSTSGFPQGAGVAVIVLGVLWLAVPIISDSVTRSRTRYALTNERALIARGGSGHRVKSYAINSQTEIDYRRGELATINFAQRRESITETSGTTQGRGYVGVGFRYLTDGEKVYDLMTKIQRGEA
ncbi:MAG: hypothetical protein AAF563_11445 [Pseudomonadota bacterium]